MPAMPENSDRMDGGQSESVVSREVTLLTDDNPIEAALLEYAEEVDQDAGLTNGDQIDLVKAVIDNLPYARHNLIEPNRGFLAAIAYPFRAYSYNNSDALMDTATFALLEAAIRFNPNEGHSFTNFAAPIIQDALVAQVPWAEKRKLLDDEKNPIYKVIKFTSAVKKAENPTELLLKAEREEAILSDEPNIILHENADVLQYIHLPNNVIYEQHGINETELYRVINKARKRLGLSSRAELALLCQEVGIQFATMPIPDTSNLRTIERAVAPLLHLPFSEIASIVGIEEDEVQAVSKRLRGKFQARSRTELVLMVKLAEVEPVHPALSPFTTAEIKVIRYIYLQTNEIVEQTGVSEQWVRLAIFRAAEKVGVHSRTALADYLYGHDFDFEVAKPKRPLVEIFSNKQLELAQNLHLPKEVLAQRLGFNNVARVGSESYRLSKRAGARSPTELMLMARVYDTGERREANTKTKREMLIGRLGGGTLDAERLQQLLDSIGISRRKFIEAYYLSTEEATWKTVAEQYKTDPISASSAAQKGIIRMKKIIQAANADSIS